MKKQVEIFCEEFCMIPDQRDKTIIVKALHPGATLKLSRETAEVLVGLLIAKLREW